jgi:ribosomal-protein-alanine N-acetyltransferase
MKPIGTKPISTARLLLRKPHPDDAAALVDIRSLPMTMPEARKAVTSMVEECEKPFCFHWVITLDDQVVGRIKCWEVDPYNGYVQLGYDVGPAYRGQGIMTEAVGAVIRFMLLEADANRVYCSVRENNHASRRVCEKNGMIHEGVLRQHYARQDGGYDDVHIYGIIKSDLLRGGK